ncbi:MAG: acylneuraminate cytidylyltransferase family protein [Bacteroides sp.]|nr:acylneuraminate cytidylyltransferase family protein [Bacteroides sp.]
MTKTASNDTLWLIPARGGSKGIPGKNVKLFCGRPLICRAIEQALECAKENDFILVSTDSPEIKDVAEGCGITVPFLRPPHLATDTASSYDVIVHALDELEKQGRQFEKIVLLQPTSPLRTSADIQEAIALWSSAVDMVVSVCEAKTNPYYNGFETDESGFLHISKGEGKFTRRQDAPKVWEYNGAVYVMTVASLRKGAMSSFKKIVPSVMSADRSVDLDTPTDWIIAEALFNQQNKL